ncbi:MAG: hypothetical protein ACI4RD_01750 [Kiritimatiellia bacterium]
MRLAYVLCGVMCGAMCASAATGVSKSDYLDLVESAVGAYAPAQISAYHARVRREGIREHGFPRLAANLGVLVAHGRRPADRELFRELMTTACAQMPMALEASKRRKPGGFPVGNDFTGGGRVRVYLYSTIDTLSLL